MSWKKEKTEIGKILDNTRCFFACMNPVTRSVRKIVAHFFVLRSFLFLSDIFICLVLQSSCPLGLYCSHTKDRILKKENNALFKTLSYLSEINTMLCPQIISLPYENKRRNMSSEGCAAHPVYGRLAHFF